MDDMTILALAPRTAIRNRTARSFRSASNENKMSDGYRCKTIRRECVNANEANRTREAGALDEILAEGACRSE